MELIIGNKVILSPILNILQMLQQELVRYNGKIREIGQEHNDNIPVTCPCNEHKGGFEKRPSCQIYTRMDNDEIQYGTCHCFACGFKASLPQLIGYCFDEDERFGEEWLLERCVLGFVSDLETGYLPEIQLNKKQKQDYVDESELLNYNYYHTYMWQRKLSKDVVNIFDVGYDPKTNCITFPVRDDKGNLVFITRRSVINKKFFIPENVDKPVYLLYYLKQHNITTCCVVEAQIDALTLWSYGIPAVATFGQPSKKQMKLLNNSGIRTFVTLFDNDIAGYRFDKRFNELIRKDVFVYNLHVPNPYKDVNDLTKEQLYTFLQKQDLNLYFKKV